MIWVGRDLGDRLVPTCNRCGIFIIIAAILSQNNTGNFPNHKPELPKNSQEIPASVSEAATTSPKHTTRGFMAGLSFPRNCSEHRGSRGVEPRGNDKRSPVRCSAGPHPAPRARGPSAGSAHPWLCLLEVPARFQSQGSQGRAGGAAEAGKPPEQRCTAHTCSMNTSGAQRERSLPAPSLAALGMAFCKS